MFKHLLSAFGIHFHSWKYFQERDRQFRDCDCGAEQEYICVPAAPGAFCTWMDV